MGPAFQGGPELRVLGLGLGGRVDLKTGPGRRFFTLPGFAFPHCFLLGGDVQAREMFLRLLAELLLLCLPWQRFCPEADAKNMLQCLKQNKNSEVMDPKCKQMITKRQITQNTGNEWSVAACNRDGRVSISSFVVKFCWPRRTSCV